MLRVISVDSSYSRAVEDEVFSNLENKNILINSIGRTDICFPVLKYNADKIFRSCCNSYISNRGSRLLTDKVMSMVNSGEFTDLEIWVDSNCRKNKEQNFTIAKTQAEAVNNFLITKQGLPEEYALLLPMGSENLLYSKNYKSKNGNIMLVFLKKEKNLRAKEIFDSLAVSEIVEADTMKVDSTRIKKPEEIRKINEVNQVREK